MQKAFFKYLKAMTMLFLKEADVIKMMKDAIGKDGKYKLGIFGLYAYLAFLEEREGKVYKVYPK